MYESSFIFTFSEEATNQPSSTSTKKSMKMKPFQPASKMSMMLMLAYLMNVATATKDYDDDFSNDQIKVDHRGDAFITAIAAWSVMVVVSTFFLLCTSSRRSSFLTFSHIFSMNILSSFVL